MGIKDVINSFEKRVDIITEEWDDIMKLPANTPVEKIERLEEKIDIVQEQNYSIIIDLNNIKRELNIDKTQETVVFCSTKLNDGYNEDELIPIEGTPEADRSLASHHSMDDIVTFLRFDNCEDDDFPTECIPSSPPRWEHNDENDGDNFGLSSGCGSRLQFPNNTRELNENNKRPRSGDTSCAKSFDLNMLDTPSTIFQLYDDFSNNLKYQIMDFERTFGKGQLSKLNKIRTYQRRRALISEIERFSAQCSVDIRVAIGIFEKFRQKRGKSVPWLYNNLAKIIDEINTEFYRYKKEMV